MNWPVPVAFYEKRRICRARLCQTPTMDLAWRFTETPYNEIARAPDRRRNGGTQLT